ncbi:ATP-dependent sacrificial sulfur transferase LarE [Candidatus Bathyarchaeota archaeon]|nr:ATP-dependent sacrificial sulfur transferase LarE [Candidatus Bathyarchaeota archaeon]MBS7614069.1 ATP-dependent sacrificial sulfur transferase LarE [Candidatus Bathyarchaeota archaeon]MBS7618232.1 ATP-dependent sacrificial sulfur transferase LarE [Candidatus Bathyarchaeota archaeon]
MTGKPKHLECKNESVLKAQALLEKLINWFNDKNSVLVAFSGGVDSTLVAYVTYKALDDKSLAVTADSLTLPPGELEDAIKIARFIGIKHRIVKVDELSDGEFVKNPPDRCYYCKRSLLKVLSKIAEEEGLKVIVDGSNADDHRDFRPGLKALKEFGVRSPLAEVGLTKSDVRLISKIVGLPTADKPSMACLASRIPYGVEVTYERLRRISEAETYIRQLTGVRQVRVRDHGYIARIEVGRDERKVFFDENVMNSIWSKLRSLGYIYVTLDLYGYKSGSLNETVFRKDKP